MKLRIDREVLADKLKKCAKFIPSKTLVNAQENFKCTVIGEMMEIMAADSQCQVKMFCPVKADSDGSFCVEAKLFLKTIDLFRENEVLITKQSDTLLELKNGKSKYKITMDCMPDDFPIMRIATTTQEMTISQFNLKTGIKFSDKFIDDKGSSKIGASGINLNNIDNKIFFTGLDDHMICRVNASVLSIVKWDKNIILPSETAIKTLSLLGDKGEVSICSNSDKVVFFTDDTIERFEIISTFINTKYPNSEMLFSKKGTDYALINTLELKDAFSRLRLYSSSTDQDKTVCMYSNLKDTNQLIMESSDTFRPKEGHEQITINNMANKSFSKKFNSGSMLKIISNIESNQLKFFFHEKNNVPCYIEPVENNDPGFNFIISSCI